MNIRRTISSLDDDEEVFDVYHQFSIAFFWKLLGGFIVLLAPFFFLYLFLQWGAIGSILLVALFFLGAFWLFRAWRVWYFTIIALTNKRVIIIVQNGILDRSVSQIDLDKIYDASYRHRGILQTLFHTGSLYITPGSFERVELKNMYYPNNIQRQIYKLQKEYNLEPARTIQPAVFDSRQKDEDRKRDIDKFFSRESD